MSEPPAPGAPVDGLALRGPEPTESARTTWAVVALSTVLFLVIATVLYGLPRSGPRDPGWLPTLNAVLNACAAVCLTVGWRLIRRGERERHRRSMLAALGFSAAFLVGYLVHHVRVGSVPYQGQGLVRTVYFAILIPHVILAAAMVPMALFTVIRALRGQFSRHRAVARWTLPVWWFVSVSGVVVYLMLHHG